MRVEVAESLALPERLDERALPTDLVVRTEIALLESTAPAML